MIYHILHISEPIPVLLFRQISDWSFNYCPFIVSPHRSELPQVTVSGSIMRSSARLHPAEKLRANKSERREWEKRVTFIGPGGAAGGLMFPDVPAVPWVWLPCCPSTLEWSSTLKNVRRLHKEQTPAQLPPQYYSWKRSWHHLFFLLSRQHE